MIRRQVTSEQKANAASLDDSGEVLLPGLANGGASV